MRFGVRARIVALTMMVLTAGGAVAGLYLEDTLRGFLEHRVELELDRHARTFDAAVRLAGKDQADRVAKELGAAASVRLSFIEDDGRVVADSDVATEDLASLDDHKTRPEVASALRGEPGVAQRTSASVDERLLYAAVPSAVGGVARAALPLAKVDALIGQIRATLVVGGLLALLVAVLGGAIASHMSTLSLRRMVVRARQLTAGDEPLRGDELDYLLGSYETMADELKRTLRSLAKARDRFEVVVEGMDQAIFRLSAKREVKLANRAALELLGLDAQPIGQSIETVLPYEGIHKLLEGEVDSDEIELPTGRRVLAHHSRMRVSRGSILVLYDVTQMRKLETVRKDFVANVSHELRTPISVIRANTEALLDDATVDPERRRTFLDAVHRASVRLSHLVADLLDLARLESGHHTLKPSPVRLADVIGACADAVILRIEEREHEVELDLEEGLFVQADPSGLEQVLVNLLDNAAKYTPARGHLAIRARRAPGGRVRIEVCDDGPGIAEKHRSRLFERFYRVDPGRSKEMGGTGLGLAIVKHLVLSMDGEVGMEPNSPRGAVFFVELPEGEAGRVVSKAA